MTTRMGLSAVASDWNSIEVCKAHVTSPPRMGLLTGAKDKGLGREYLGKGGLPIQKQKDPRSLTISTPTSFWQEKSFVGF